MGTVTLTAQLDKYEIKASPLHSQGVFACVDIAKETVILREKPLWRLSLEQGLEVARRADKQDPCDLRLLGGISGQLNRSTKKRLYELHGFEGTSHDRCRWIDHDHQRLGEQALQIYVFNALSKNEGPVYRRRRVRKGIALQPQLSALDRVRHQRERRDNHGCYYGRYQSRRRDHVAVHRTA